MTPADVKHVAVIGDSYTSGAGATPWPKLVWQRLAHDGITVEAHVRGEGGSGYVTPGHQGTTFGQRVAQVVGPGDQVVVFFGSRNDRHADHRELADRARDAFEQANQRAPQAKLLVIGPVWPSAPAPPEIIAVRDVLCEQATRAGAAFVDPVAEGWLVDRPDLIQDDGIHPNDVGQAVLAESITSSIRSELLAGA